MALSVDIVSDVGCPWCFIGKRRLESALALYREAFPDQPEPELRWWPFQVNPDMPPEGMDRYEYRLKKYGPEKAPNIPARVVAAGREMAIPFAFDKIRRQPNTVAAHCLLTLAVEHGVQRDMKEALLSAFFIEGEDLSDEATLVRLAVKVGLPEDAAREAMKSETMRQEVATHEAQAHKLGVSGVPFFIFNGVIGLSGAQPPETMFEAMTKSEEEVKALAEAAT